MRRLLAVLLALSLGAAAMAAPQAAKKTKKRPSKAVVRQTQPDPARTRQIQAALQREGYLDTAPTGRWDEATRQAMARYQQENGFTVSGKPDARSLIKLGLGPKYP